MFRYSLTFLWQHLLGTATMSPNASIRGIVRRILPMYIHRWLLTLRQRQYRTLVSPVRFGSLRRVRPFSREFGCDHGFPIDRYYIESFLARQAGDIRGRVLETKDNSYPRRYGGDRVKHSNVFDTIESNPQATIVTDPTQADYVPSDTFTECAQWFRRFTVQKASG